MEEKIKEGTGTGAVAGFQTPYAFKDGQKGDPHKDMGNIRAATQLGYSKVEEVEKADAKTHPKDAKPAAQKQAVQAKPAVKAPATNVPVKKLDQTGDGRITTGDAVVAAKKSKIAQSKGDKKDADFYKKVQQIVNKRLGHKV